ncbi:aspartyl protease family protein [Pontibacter silvestris]|uniref:Aspartyl protease family protein n=1 Tax=Pontibacter silvestris TaxID=2305183 RepID=A0ABW4WXT5_9BACT|nr:aspartyl protease family protein [Pontibacter silvestris]MCC9135328.1 aspartyl protease family protein [Pontibacter silvestris]
MTRLALLLMLCLLYSCGTKAQEVLSQKRDTAYFAGKRKHVTIPFKLVHNLIIIPVKINNSTELNFILDSGVKNTLITRLYYSDSLNLNHTNKLYLNGLGTGYDIEAIHSTGNTMSLPGIRGDNHEVYVLLEDIFNLSTRMGMPMHGIIGYDIFKNFVVKINYSSKRLTLYRPDIYVKTKKRAEEYPLHLDKSKAYIFANINQHNGDSLKVKLVIDTGASHSLSLYLPSDNRISLPPKVMEAYLGRGLNGDINGKIGRLNSFKIGKYELLNLPASYPDKEAIQLAINLSNRNGNLGSEVLKRFDVLFDYPHKRLVLIPNKKFKEPFHYNLAGFEVSTPLPGTNLYIVSNVVDNSPAKQVGLQPGDQLLLINGKSCSDLQLTEVLEMLESKPGRKLKMKLRRESQEIDVNLVLQSRI